MIVDDLIDLCCLYFNLHMNFVYVTVSGKLIKLARQVKQADCISVGKLSSITTCKMDYQE